MCMTYWVGSELAVSAAIEQDNVGYRCRLVLWMLTQDIEHRCFVMQVEC